MDSRARVQIVLAKGYFPKELPPAFTTSDFGRLSSDIMKDWEFSLVVEKRPAAKFQGKHKSGFYVYKIGDTEAEIISTPKRGFERRKLHIVHPVPQAYLAREICDNWITIQKWLIRQQYTVDKIYVAKAAYRGIPDINFGAHRAKKSYIEATANWLVKTDITRFYPSIYTHSIPWAAYGKERVKGKLKLYAGSLADRLDQLMRACNRNQTVGIPVGPETSRIVAEVISSRVDQDFSVQGHRLDTSQIDRLQDDWYIGCDSLEQAELSLSAVIKSYRDYGLEINGNKTSIERITSVSEQEWTSEIGAFLSHGSGVPRGRRLSEFLALCLRMQVAYPTQPFANYALSVIENHRTLRNDSSFVESFLLRLMTISPSSLNIIARVLINLHHDTGGVSLIRVAKRVRNELNRHISHGNDFEAIWLLYILRGLSLHVSYADIKGHINPLNASAFALILLDMDSRKLVRGTLPKSEWSAFITADVANATGLWLLAYEGIRHGWLTDPYGLAATPLFKPMLDRDVVFYDPRRNVPTSKSTAIRKRTARARFRRVTISLIQTLRGFDGEDY